MKMPEFRTKDCLGFLTHWKSLRSDSQLMPLQTDFLDQPHPHYAPSLLIVEVMPENLVIRLMGTELVERWGRDKTGEAVGQDQPPEMRDAMFAYAQKCIAHSCGVRMEMDFASVKGAEMSVEAIVLPLSLGPDKPMRLLSYSAVLKSLKHGDHSDRYLGVPVAEWIDLGAGVPAREAWTVQK